MQDTKNHKETTVNHPGGFAVSYRESIRVGLLYSLTGTTSIIERSQYDAAMLAIEQINAAGGINGRPIEPVHEDFGSSPSRAMEKAEKLILQDRCVATLGCYTSASRQAALKVFQRENSILLYPTLYEGQECNPNGIYTGAVPNQQLTDFIPWIIRTCGSDLYLIGSDYVYPRETNRIVRALIEIHQGRVIGEEYLPLGHTDFREVLRRIWRAKPHSVFSTLVGNSVVALYQQFRKYGYTAAELPITSPITTEEEIRAMGAECAAGHFTSANYFQSVDTPQNLQFVEAFQARYGRNRATNFVMEAAYFQIYLLAQALQQSRSHRTEDLLPALIGQEFLAPQGPVKIHTNHHTYLTARIGQATSNGQFNVVWQSRSSIKPEPWFEDYAESYKQFWDQQRKHGMLPTTS